MTINAVPVITTSSPLPGGKVGVSYSQSLTASPTGTLPDVWSVSSGTLPAGLSLSSGGVLSGTPSAWGVSSFTALVTEANSRTDSKAFSLTINPGGGSAGGASMSGKVSISGRRQSVVSKEKAGPMTAPADLLHG